MSPNNSMPSGMMRSMMYLVGFLTAFVVFLLLFIGCVLVSRGRFAARQQRAGHGDPQDSEDGVRYVRPVWEERWVEKGELGAVWAEITPLSAVVRPDSEKGEHGDGEGNETTGRSPPTSPPSSVLCRLSFSILSWLSGANTSKDPDLGSTPRPATIPLDSKAELHVAIMVSMPHDPETHGPPVYEFGLATAQLGGGMR